jgi:hypothetical protein
MLLSQLLLTQPACSRRWTMLVGCKESDESYAGLRVSVGTGDALGHALFTSMEVSL